MPFLVRNEKLRNLNRNKRSKAFENDDGVSIKSGLSINSNDNDNISEGYEEIRDILLTNQKLNKNLKQPKPSLVDEKNILPLLKPSSFTQSNSYLNDTSQQSISYYTNSSYINSKQFTKKLDNNRGFPQKKIPAEIHTFSFEPLDNDLKNGSQKKSFSFRQCTILYLKH